MTTPPNVFISATSADLRSIRALVREVLLTINCHPVDQETFEPDWRTVRDLLPAKIADCQALVHIVGLRYGAEPDLASLPPDAPRRSYTQMEYDIGRRLQAGRGDDYFRVYTFVLPETFPYDQTDPLGRPVPPEDEERTRLQLAHRTTLLDDPHLHYRPADRASLHAQLLSIQEHVLSLKREQAAVGTEVLKNRRLGLKAFAILFLILGGIGFWQWRTKKDSGILVAGQIDLAAQMSQVQEALSRIQQETNPRKDPISAWPQERLERELARQMNWPVADLRALLSSGKTSVDALVSGQALLASGKSDEAGQKFDSVIAQEQSMLERLRQAYGGKAQIAYDKARFEEALGHRQKAAALVDKAADPGEWASAQAWVATTLYELARYQEAEPLKRDVLRLLEEHFGSNAPETAAALTNLALLLQDTNRLSEAEPLMRRALNISEASFGPNNPHVAKCLSNLALLLQDTNRLTEAEPLMRRALNIAEISYRPDHVEIAIHLNNMALLFQAANRLTEAEPLMRRSLKIAEARYNPDDPNIARILNNLASLLHAMKRLTEAEPLMQRALKINESSYGPDHPRVAMDLNNLAQLLQDTNRLTEAEPLMRRSLMINESSYGPDHPHVAVHLNNLGLLLQKTNRPTEAEPLMRRALKIAEDSYGPGHPDVAIGLHNLARLLRATNRITEAEPLMRRSLGIFLKFQAHTGHRHPHSVVAVRNYLSIARKIKVADMETRARLDKLRQEVGLEKAALEAIWQEIVPPTNPPSLF